MDGVAVRSADIALASFASPVSLRVIGERMAGDGEKAYLLPKTAIFVATGAVIPEGCDAVVKQEDIDSGRAFVRIFRSLLPGENICPAGEDLEQGSLALSEGDRIGRTEMGLLGSLGQNCVKVRRRARVALPATGSELTEAGEMRMPGKIYESITPMLSASVLAAGLELTMREILEDDAEAMKNALRKAADCADFIVTTGGVSVGRRDLIPGA